MEPKRKLGTRRNEQQRQMILTFIEQNPELQIGNFSYGEEKWKKITKRLNAVAGGARKDWSHWRKSYYDDRRVAGESKKWKKNTKQDDDEETTRQRIETQKNLVTTKRNAEQRQMIVEFIEQNPDLQIGNFTHGEAKWQAFAERLNAVVGGARKDWSQWRKSYYDYVRVANAIKKREICEPSTVVGSAVKRDVDKECGVAAAAAAVETCGETDPLEFVNIKIESEAAPDNESYEELELVQLEIKCEKISLPNPSPDSNGTQLNSRYITNEQKLKMVEYMELNKKHQ